MNRSELVLRLVLNAICDDYENVDQIIEAALDTCASRPYPESAWK
jgi:hypothetical protein